MYQPPFQAERDLPQPPYDSWTFFLRKHWRNTELVAAFLKIPPDAGVETLKDVEEFVQKSSRLEDRWGNVSVYDEDFCDWMDEQ